ncbi:transglutaminase family protein [Pseudoruegeria sp. SK021]|uniref:transglutaminase family protein n=1 Tax=Pseudoruegeria sp. SK021 TaxID=1933035 RepID=UPI000A25D396|nr:transglutaminase family protein [Pseudoruegeria sp. SK021]OSP55269.1 transglutaminase [Pseudoruegeria sp. SK021]
MKLTVSHSTTYSYSGPRRHVLQSQRLVPSDFDGQRVLDWTVTTEGGTVGCEFRDGAGDRTCTVSVPGPVDRVTVQINGTIETFDTLGVLRGFREKVPPFAYLRATRVTRSDVALQALSEQTLTGLEGANLLDRAHALSAAVTEAIAYRPGTTESMTTAAEALAQGQGVCQDQAHALIALALLNEIPARYVIGYLFSAGAEADVVTLSDDVRAELPNSEAGHAWAELYIDGMGWVGFDPANACCPDERYIRLCSGADAFEAAPIRGLASGTGGEDLQVVVAVEAVQQ